MAAALDDRSETYARHLEGGGRLSIRTETGQVGHLRATRRAGGGYELTVHHTRTGKQLHSAGVVTKDELRAGLTSHGKYARKLRPKEAAAASGAKPSQHHLSGVTEGDLKDAAAFWRAHAPIELAGLIDAKAAR